MLQIAGVGEITSFYFNWNYKCVYCDFGIFTRYIQEYTLRAKTSRIIVCKRSFFLQTHTYTHHQQALCGMRNAYVWVSTLSTEGECIVHIWVHPHHIGKFQSIAFLLALTHALYPSAAMNHAPAHWLHAHSYRFYHRKFKYTLASFLLRVKKHKCAFP